VNWPCHTLEKQPGMDINTKERNPIALMRQRPGQKAVSVKEDGDELEIDLMQIPATHGVMCIKSLCIPACMKPIRRLNK